MTDFSSWLDDLTERVRSKEDPAPEVNEPEEGDTCPVCGEGEIIISQDPCYCGAAPAPCPACTRAWLECTACDEQWHPNEAEDTPS